MMQLHKRVGWRTLMVITVLALCELGASTNRIARANLRAENSGDIGWRPIPNQNARFGRRGIPCIINSYGCRDREWNLPRADDGVFRIALLGNSLTFGAGVTIEETWGRRLESLIKEDDANRGIEREVLVMNFASQGFVLDQMVLAYERFARAFHPDLVLIGTVPHDIVPHCPAPAPSDSPFRRTIAMTDFHHLLSQTAIGPLHTQLTTPWGVDRQRERALRIEAAVKRAPLGIDTMPYWDLALERAAALEAQVHQDGARFVVLPLPRFADMAVRSRKTHRSIWGRWTRRNWQKGQPGRTLMIDAREHFEVAMADLWAAIRAKGVDRAYRPVKGSLRGVLDPSLPHREQCLFLEDDRGHYSAKGHRVVGDAAFLRLSNAGYLDPVELEQRTASGQ